MPREETSASASASALASASTGVPTPERLRRNELRAKILEVLMSEGGVAEPPARPAPTVGSTPSAGSTSAHSAPSAGSTSANTAPSAHPAGDEREERDLTVGLTGVPAANFPTEYIAEIYRDQLGPMTHACFEAARARNPDAGGQVLVRYVVVAAPGVGGIVEDATVDESSLADDELETCIHESVLTLTFDRAPDEGGWKEAGFVMALGADGG